METITVKVSISGLLNLADITDYLNNDLKASINNFRYNDTSELWDIEFTILLSDAAEKLIKLGQEFPIVNYISSIIK